MEGIFDNSNLTWLIDGVWFLCNLTQTLNINEVELGQHHGTARGKGGLDDPTLLPPPLLQLRGQITTLLRGGGGGMYVC